MNLLKIKVKGRIERILNFDPKSVRYANDNYVIDIDDNDYCLIEMNTKGNHLVDNESQHPNLYIKEIRQTTADGEAGNGNNNTAGNVENIGNEENNGNGENDGNENNMILEAELAPTPEDEHTQIQIEDTIANNLKDKISIYYNEGVQTVKLIQPLNNQHIELILKIGEVERSLHFYFEQIVYRAVVDFGSEASQVKIWESNSRLYENVNLIAGIESSISAAASNTPESSDYVQKDPGDNLLYRTINYIRNNNNEEGNEPDNANDNENNKPDYSDHGIIKYLVRGDDATVLANNKYIQIPNTKLASFDIDCCNYGANLRQGIVPRLVINNIVYQTLRAIDNNRTRQRPIVDSAAATLYMMMPNVYPIHIVTQKLNELAEDIKKWIGSDFRSISGVELRYLSESYASLLGYAEDRRSRRNQIDGGKYLIIDAGKGTLDYSVIEVGGNNTTFTSLARGGTVGAGAVITYGVMLALLNDFLCNMCVGHKDSNEEGRRRNIKEFISKKILSEPDIAERNNAMQNIEKYKVFYNEKCKEGPCFGEETTTSASSKSIDALTLGEFNTFVTTLITNRTLLSAESYAYLCKEIDSVVKEAVSSIKISLGKDAKGNEIKADHVLFTGRGCMMHELRTKLKKQLLDEEILTNDSCLLPNGGKWKTVCMNIINYYSRGHYDTQEARQAIGLFPHVRNTQTNTHQQARLNFSDLLSECIGSIPSRFKHFITSRLMLIKKGRAQSLGGYNNEYQYSGSTVQGVEFTVQGAFDIIIGGWSNTLNEKFNGKKVSLYFDGINYVAIANTETGVCTQTLDDESPYRPELGYETLFPNVNSDSEVKVPSLQ